MRNWMAEKPCLGGIERKGSGNEYLITLLRKAGFACHPFLGGKQFPKWNPQEEFTSDEENNGFQGFADGTRLFIHLF